MGVTTLGSRGTLGVEAKERWSGIQRGRGALNICPVLSPNLLSSFAFSIGKLGQKREGDHAHRGTWAT